jgi:hypothetical protein
VIEPFTGGLDITFGAPRRLVGELHGLLNAVAAGTSVLATDTVLLGGNGKRYTVDPTTTAGFTTIYRSFAPSWAITKKQSLFSYLPGKGPSSYRVKGFPARNFDATTVPPAFLGLYETRCRADGVTNGNLLRGCVVDQAALGTKYVDIILRAVARELALASLTAGSAPQPAPATPSVPAAPATTPTTQPPVAAGTTVPTNVSASTVQEIVKHPCTLLTPSEADAAADTRFAAAEEIASAELCSYEKHPADSSTINISLVEGTVAQALPPKGSPGNTFTPEPSLGAEVTWVVEKGIYADETLYFPLGKVGSTSYTVKIQLEGGLPEASMLARDCFTHM